MLDLGKRKGHRARVCQAQLENQEFICVYGSVSVMRWFIKRVLLMDAGKMVPFENIDAGYSTKECGRIRAIGGNSGCRSQELFTTRS